MDYDLIIQNGQLVDGTGNPSFKADIGIRDEKIARVGDLASSTAESKINADKHIVSPGFIDIHSHSDFTLLIDPSSKPKIMQGVTTEVIGNCGFSAAPVRKERSELLRKNLTSIFPEAIETSWTWTSMNEYLSHLKEKGISVNVAPLVGHGTIRMNVMGDGDGSPTESELNDMKSLLNEALTDGAFGMSSGLIYHPSMWANTKELIALCKIVKKFGGIYATHIRGEDRGRLVRAVHEALQIGFNAGIPVEISHHKAAGKDNWGAVKKTLGMIDEALSNGLEVSCDIYPYTASSTMLRTLLPSWVERGGIERIKDRMKDSLIRKKIRKDMEKDFENQLQTTDPKNILISYCKRKKMEGKNFAEIMEMKSKNKYDTLFDLLSDDLNTQMIIFKMSENNVKTIITHRASMIGSDGCGLQGRGKPHPRLYGTFPRVLRKYVRDDPLVTLEEAIRKMTSFPAQKLGLKLRGLLRKGMFADIVVFNLNRIADKATYKDPHQTAKGISHVLVNGEITVCEGRYTGTLAGRCLRKGGF